MPVSTTIVSEVLHDETQFKHRLVCSDGRVTSWANYQKAVILDDVIAVTPFWHAGRDIHLISPKDFALLVCIGVDHGPI